MKVYPRTENRTWTWPIEEQMRNTLDALSVPSVCTFNTVSRRSSISFTDSVSFGENYPDWRKRLRDGIATTTSLSGVKAVVKVPSGTCNWYNSSANVYCMNGAGWGQYTGFLLTLHDPGSGPDGDADARAKAKLLQSYISAVNTWRGGNFVAELGESINMVLHPVKSIYSRTWDYVGTMKRLKRVYRRSPLNYAKAIADAWLAYVFGIKPFVDDANDACLALSRLGEGGRADVYHNLRGSSRTEAIVSRSTGQVTPIGWAGNSYVSDVTVKKSLKVRYVGGLRVGSEDLHFQMVEFGIGALDFAPAVWEAIPFSFVVDYFLNVQEMIDGLKFLYAKPNRLDLCVRNAGVVQVGSPYSLGNAPTYSTSIRCGVAHSLVVRVSRQPLFEFPYIGYRFKCPGINSMRWLNIAALVEQWYSTKPHA